MSESRRFENKVALVTGAAGALGRAIATRFASEGARVIRVDISEELLGKAFTQKTGAGHLDVAADLTDRANTKQALDQAIATCGGLDLVANIAGGFRMGDPVHEIGDEDWDFLFNLNTRTILNTAAVVVPALLQRGRGAVINVGALGARSGVAAMGAYTASKSATIRLTEAMAEELKESGINVNCIMPGIIDTPANRDAMPDADPSKWAAPVDIAAVVAFLASDEARIIHGASVPVPNLS